MHQTDLDLPEGASTAERFSLMLHERLIANEEKLVKLQDEVVDLKQQCQKMSAHHTAAEIAVSLFAETIFCGIQGFSSIYGKNIVTPEVLRHLKCHNIGIVHDTANSLYVLNISSDRIKLYVEYPQLLQNALQTLWPDNKYELSRTVLIQTSRKTAFTSQLFDQAHI